jgi:hypothetical protein
MIWSAFATHPASQRHATPNGDATHARVRWRLTWGIRVDRRRVERQKRHGVLGAAPTDQEPAGGRRWERGARRRGRAGRMSSRTALGCLSCMQTTDEHLELLEALASDGPGGWEVALIGTLWSAHSPAAEVFFATLYAQLRKGDSRLDAFAAAQRSARDRFPDPGHWARSFCPARGADRHGPDLRD